MIETIEFIRDAEKNADAFYSAEAIRNNMNEYFTGMACMLELITGNGYHWSNGENGNEWALVIFNGSTGIEERISIAE